MKLCPDISELQVLVGTLSEHVNHAGGLLVRQLRRREHLVAKRDKQYDVITAHLQARSEKRSEFNQMMRFDFWSLARYRESTSRSRIIHSGSWLYELNTAKWTSYIKSQ